MPQRANTAFPNDFATTQWSIVFAANGNDGERAAIALDHLCRKYWRPLFHFVRRRGYQPAEAEDLTQAFFGYLLQKETLQKVDRSKGKFRTFLVTALSNFLANEWDKKSAQKRGGRVEFVTLADAQEHSTDDFFDRLSPEKFFERTWAIALVEQVFIRLRQEYKVSGNEKLLARLEPVLTQPTSEGFYRECARDLGMTEGAVTTALHRLRRRFGELLRSEVAHTVSSPHEIEDEIRSLLAAISM